MSNLKEIHRTIFLDFTAIAEIEQRCIETRQQLLEIDEKIIDVIDLGECQDEEARTPQNV